MSQLTREELLAKVKQRQNEQKGQNTFDPNPSACNIKWKQIRERKDAVINGTPINVEVLSGGFGFYVKAENPKAGESPGKNVFIPNEKFKMMIIDHSIIRLEGTEYAGQAKVRSWYSTEMRQQDCMTNPFILQHKREGDKDAATFIDTYKNLKEDLKINGRMHKIYGMSSKGEMICLILPYYSYSKGSDRFKTHGDTLLDADSKSTSGGMAECWLTVTGFVELRSTPTSPPYTAPQFTFAEKVSDDDLAKYFDLCAVFDDWYAAYHKSNLLRIDKKLGGIANNEHDQTDHRESHSQDDAATPSDSSLSNTPNPEWVEDDDLDGIPF